MIFAFLQYNLVLLFALSVLIGLFLICVDSDLSVTHNTADLWTPACDMPADLEIFPDVMLAETPTFNIFNFDVWWSADLSTTDLPKHCWQDNTPEENSDGVHCNWGSTVLWQPAGSSCAVQHTQWHCGKGWFVTVCVSDQNLPTPSCNEAGLLVIVFQIKTYQHHHAMRLVCWLLCFRSKLTNTIMQWGWFVGYCVSDQNLPTPSCNEAGFLVIVFQIKTYQHHHAMRLICWLLCFRSKLTNTIMQRGWFVGYCGSDQNLPTPSCNEAGLLVIVFQIKTYQHHHAMRLVCWLLCFRSKLTNTIMQWGWFVGYCVSDQNLPTPSCNEADLLVIVFQIKTYQHHHAMRLVCWLLCFRSKLTNTIMQSGWFVGICIQIKTYTHHHAVRTGLLVINFVFQIKTYTHHHAVRTGLLVFVFQIKTYIHHHAARVGLLVFVFQIKLAYTIMQ